MKSIHAVTDWLQNCQWSHMHSGFWKLQSEKGLVHTPILWRKYAILTVLHVVFNVWCDGAFPTLEDFIIKPSVNRSIQLIFRAWSTVSVIKWFIANSKFWHSLVSMKISVSVKARSVPTTLTDCAYSFWRKMYLKSAQFADVPRLKLFGW